MPKNRKTDHIQPEPTSTRLLDRIDRKILGELAKEADISYAELGKRVNLSPPAVHERVKRLKSSGHIQQTVALLNGKLINKPLLAFVLVDTIGWGKTKELIELGKLPEVEEIHSVTGDTCMMLKVRLQNSEALEGLLGRLYDIPGVKGTRTYVVLSTYLERPTQAEITSKLSIEAREKWEE